MQPAVLLTRKDLARLHRANKTLTDLVTRLERVLGEVSGPVLPKVRTGHRRLVKFAGPEDMRAIPVKGTGAPGLDRP